LRSAARGSAVALQVANATDQSPGLWAPSTPSSVIEHDVEVAELSPTVVRVANRTLLRLIVNAQVPGTMWIHVPPTETSRCAGE